MTIRDYIVSKDLLKHMARQKASFGDNELLTRITLIEDHWNEACQCLTEPERIIIRKMTKQFDPTHPDNEAIAAEMGVGVRYVQKHRKNAYIKMTTYLNDNYKTDLEFERAYSKRS